MPYDSTTGIISIDSSTTPPKGVSVYDVQRALGDGHRDVGSLCSSPKINTWAKYKPYRSGLLYTSAEARAAAHYGLNIDVFTSLGTPSTPNSFLAKLVAGELEWEYLSPRGEGGGTGGANEWYRLLDFNGYNRNAVCPVGDVYPVTVFTDGSGTIAWDLLGSLPTGNLSLADFTAGGEPLTAFYLGVLLYQTDSRYHIVTSTTTLGQGDVQILLTGVPASEMGTWYAYPFFSSVQISFDGQTGAGVYLSAGWTKYEVLTFRDSSSSLTVTVFAAWNASHTGIRYQIYATNLNSSQATLQNVTVHLRKNQDGSTPPVSGSDLLQVAIGTIAVPGASGGSPGEYISIVQTASYDGSDYQSYFYWMGADATGIATTFLPIEEVPEGE